MGPFGPRCNIVCFVGSFPRCSLSARTVATLVISNIVLAVLYSIVHLSVSAWIGLIILLVVLKGSFTVSSEMLFPETFEVVC